MSKIIYEEGYYTIIQEGKHSFISLYCMSQIGYIRDTEEGAKAEIQSHKDSTTKKKQEQSTWKLRKQLDPNNPRHLSLAQRNGFYLSHYSPVYEYVDPLGFLHYTRAAI